MQQSPLRLRRVDPSGTLEGPQLGSTMCSLWVPDRRLHANGSNEDEYQRGHSGWKGNCASPNSAFPQRQPQGTRVTKGSGSPLTVLHFGSQPGRMEVTETAHLSPFIRVEAF